MNSWKILILMILKLMLNLWNYNLIRGNLRLLSFMLTSSLLCLLCQEQSSQCLLSGRIKHPSHHLIFVHLVKLNVSSFILSFKSHWCLSLKHYVILDTFIQGSILKLRLNISGSKMKLSNRGRLFIVRRNSFGWSFLCFWTSLPQLWVISHWLLWMLLLIKCLMVLLQSLQHSLLCVYLSKSSMDSIGLLLSLLSLVWYWLDYQASYF